MNNAIGGKNTNTGHHRQRLILGSSGRYVARNLNRSRKNPPPPPEGAVSSALEYMTRIGGGAYMCVVRPGNYIIKSAFRDAYLSV